MKRKYRNEMFGTALDITTLSTALGLGANLVESVGGDAKGIDTLAKFQAPIAKVRGGNILLNTLLDVHKDINKKLRRRY